MILTKTNLTSQSRMPPTRSPKLARFHENQFDESMPLPHPAHPPSRPRPGFFQIEDYIKVYKRPNSPWDSSDFEAAPTGFWNMVRYTAQASIGVVSRFILRQFSFGSHFCFSSSVYNWLLFLARHFCPP